MHRALTREEYYEQEERREPREFHRKKWHVMADRVMPENEGHSAFIQTFDPNRVCSDDSCETVLSIYNPGDLCATHELRHRMATLEVVE